MPVKDVEYCDMCHADGYKRRAVAQYWSEDNKLWFACAKHLNFVKEAQLEFEMLPEEE